MKYTIAIAGTETSNSSPIYRNIKCADGLVATPDPSIKTVYDLVSLNLNRNPDLHFFGQRRIINMIEEEKEVIKKVPGGGEVKEMKQWRYFELSGFEWLNWRQSDQLIRTYASGYRALGLSKGDRLTIYSETCRDWIFNALACVSQSIVVTTAYATLGEDGLCHTLQEGDVSVLFTNADLLPMVVKVASRCKDLKTIIFNGTVDPSSVDVLKGCGIRVLSLLELQALGESNPTDPVPPSPSDLAVIMYTSGSSGTPKGVCLTHENLISSIIANYDGIKHVQQPEEMYLSFLPLAHVYELCCELLCLFMGVPIGFGSVKTLTDASVRNCRGDIAELRPTVLMGVPALWETMRKGVQAKINDSSTVSKFIYEKAFNLKTKFKAAGLPYGLLNSLVFDKIKKQLGGRLRVGTVAGANCPASTLQFLNTAVADVIAVYGMTETTGTILTQTLHFGSVGTVNNVGAVALCNEVKLVNVEGTGYFVSNKPKPQGELWVRGINVTQGYFKQEELTRETIDEDGWLKTGDIAELNEDGTFTLIDRKKNLIKLSNGEYIALEKLESNYKVSKYVQNICVYADSEQSYSIALIQPVEKEIRKLAATLTPDTNAEELEWEELCNRKDIRNVVLLDLKAIAKLLNFASAEVVGQVLLSAFEWTPQNGYLTAAMKLQRRFIVNKYKNEIDAIYSGK
ncbi:UNVERIFIED_CONTAM: long-chain fatty acid-CoA ligase [Siphonaria sp. JEL0065]|nr:long-chain fatty acid-CoA ligase [Siphonaria sp. JEL0065]